MGDLPNELPNELPLQIRQRYQCAFSLLSANYSKKQIVNFLRTIRTARLDFIAANGLTNPKQKTGIARTHGPAIPFEALLHVQELLDALDEARDVADFGIAEYLGDAAVIRLQREATSASRNEANKKRKESSETWKAPVRDWAEIEWNADPRSSYESVAGRIFEKYRKELATVTCRSYQTIERFLKEEKLKPGKSRKKEKLKPGKSR